MDGREIDSRQLKAGLISLVSSLAHAWRIPHPAKGTKRAGRVGGLAKRKGWQAASSSKCKKNERRALLGDSGFQRRGRGGEPPPSQAKKRKVVPRPSRTNPPAHRSLIHCESLAELLPRAVVALHACRLLLGADESLPAPDAATGKAFAALSQALAIFLLRRFFLANAVKHFFLAAFSCT